MARLWIFTDTLQESVAENAQVLVPGRRVEWKICRSEVTYAWTRGTGPSSTHNG